MPADGDISVVPAGVGVVVENLLAGRQYERLPAGFRWMVRIFAIGSNGAVGDASLECSLGQRILSPRGALGFNAGGLDTSRDEIAQGTGGPGDLVKLRATNNNAAARNIAWRVSYQAIAPA